MVRRTLVLLVVASMLAALGAAPSNAAIINGEPAGAGRWPSFTYVQTTNGTDSFDCGGSLIAAEWVLTAAHCIVDAKTGELQFTPDQVAVSVGRSDQRTEDGEPNTVVELIAHPGYRPPDDVNDVALLRLGTPSSAPLQRLVAADQAAAFAPGVEATVIGIGATDPQAQTAAEELLEVQVPVAEDARCAPGYAGYDTERMICAGEPGPEEDNPGRDSCQGDSGGPLMVPEGDTFLQVGVVSFGGVCGVQDPGVYVELIQYLEWIQSVVGGEPTATPADDPDNPGSQEQGAAAEALRISGAGPLASSGAMTEPVSQAAAISEVSFDRGEAEYGLIARADDYADALGGSSLGFGLAPLLFATQNPQLPEATRLELIRAVAPGSPVYVLGGNVAVPGPIDDELRALGFEPIRLFGAAREETAAQVADEVLDTLEFEGVPQDTIIVATRGNWPDAVTAGQIGAWWGYPILLTQPDSLHPAAREVLARRAPSKVLVIGGQAVVADSVVAEIEAVTGPGSTTRLGGATRTGTSAAVLTHHLGLYAQLTPGEDEGPFYAAAVNIRRDDGFAHVLSASTLAGLGAVFVPLDSSPGDVLTEDVAAAACGLDLPLLIAGGGDLIGNGGVEAVRSALLGQGCSPA
jgi:putative cell wall-binding protein